MQICPIPMLIHLLKVCKYKMQIVLFIKLLQNIINDNCFYIIFVEKCNTLILWTLLLILCVLLTNHKRTKRIHFIYIFRHERLRITTTNLSAKPEYHYIYYRCNVLYIRSCRICLYIRQGRL